jgi:hypothetical protein
MPEANYFFARKLGTSVHMPTGLRHSIQAKTPRGLLLKESYAGTIQSSGLIL